MKLSICGTKIEILNCILLKFEIKFNYFSIMCNNTLPTVSWGELCSNCNYSNHT